MTTRKRIEFEDDPLWYKDAVIYQTHVKSFCDSNGDGIGDFPGLKTKLDYLEGLGVTAIWILPFYPSPQKDDGYDISDLLRRTSGLRQHDGFQAVPARGAQARASG